MNIIKVAKHLVFTKKANFLYNQFDNMVVFFVFYSREPKPKRI